MIRKVLTEAYVQMVKNSIPIVFTYVFKRTIRTSMGYIWRRAML